MAYDGFTTAAIVRELNDQLSGGRINKIAQPEPDALVITARGKDGQIRILLSANASLPLLYVTGKNRVSPLTAPNFCMLLRKHIGTARILSVTQPGLERVVEFSLEHLDDMGDVCHKRLILELMGKHSNIIFCDEDGMILDSIKHISANISSVREVLPGREYFIPQTQEKLDPLAISEEDFTSLLSQKPLPLSKAIYTSLTGFSPVMANELCYRASLDPDTDYRTLEDHVRVHLYHTFRNMIDQLAEGEFSPCIVYREEEPVEFGVLGYRQYGREYRMQSFPSVSSMLETYYDSRDLHARIRQKSADLRRVVQTCLERESKKYNLQLRQLKDTEKKDKYKIYGELINTYGYGVETGAKSFRALNYYTGEEIDVPLDPQLSPSENAKKYFDRYGKMKRTEEALSVQTAETAETVEHLSSIAASLDIARTESDLAQIKEELTQFGYIRKHPVKEKKGKTGKMQQKSKPFHFVSSDGYDMYVGRNNFQNDELTFHFASGNDWWFHAKKMPGSHVIVKVRDGEVPDRVFEEAGNLAAYFSSGKTAPKVEIDYIQKKHVKKPAGAKPGFVVYYTNYSLIASPDISMLKEVDD
ncbi:MAG: NFACT family protein [Blautia sp.]|nr:NFACT family protein [Blautia sp.]